MKKERYKKLRKHYISPIRGEAPPPWTDFHQILHIRRYARHNHLCKFWCEKLRGLGYTGGSNFGLSHWNGWSPLQQCCTTAQPVMVENKQQLAWAMISNSSMVWDINCSSATSLRPTSYNITLQCTKHCSSYVHHHCIIHTNWIITDIILSCGN